MLSIALINFLVFWLYVNVDSILMAFQLPAKQGTEWSFDNFTRFFKEVRIPAFEPRPRDKKYDAFVPGGHVDRSAAQRTARVLPV